MAPSLRIAAATAADIEPIAADMRPEDAAEVMASGGRTPEQALRSSWLSSAWAFTAHDADGPVAMFGVARWSNTDGCPWLLATPRLLTRHAASFARASRAVVGCMRNEFTSLENFVDARNIKSVRWLRWLGFTIHPAQPWGVAGLPFHRFTWRK